MSGTVPSHAPRGREFDSRSVTFPPPGFDRCFRDVFPTGISALGSLWDWGKIKFYLRVKSLPGDNPKRPSGPILDPTVVVRDESAQTAYSLERSPPLARICGMSRLYFTCIPPVSHRILGISLCPCISIYI